MVEEATQCVLKISTKNELDIFKSMHKDKILKKVKKTKRFVTNDDAIRYLLAMVKKDK